MQCAVYTDPFHLISWCPTYCYNYICFMTTWNTYNIAEILSFYSIVSWDISRTFSSVFSKLFAKFSRNIKSEISQNFARNAKFSAKKDFSTLIKQSAVNSSKCKESKTTNLIFFFCKLKGLFRGIFKRIFICRPDSQLYSVKFN